MLQFWVALVPLVVKQSTEQSDAIVLKLHGDVLKGDEVPLDVAVESAELVGREGGWS